MADDTAPEQPKGSDYRVCAPLVRAKTSTHEGVRWLDFGDGAPLPDDIDPEWLAHLSRKKLIRHKDDPIPTGIFAWPGSMGATQDGEAMQAEVIRQMDAIGQEQVAATRARGRRAKAAAADPDVTTVAPAAGASTDSAAPGGGAGGDSDGVTFAGGSGDAG